MVFRHQFFVLQQSQSDLAALGVWQNPDGKPQQENYMAKIPKIRILEMRKPFHSKKHFTQSLSFKSKRHPGWRAEYELQTFASLWERGIEWYSTVVDGTKKCYKWRDERWPKWTKILVWQIAKQGHLAQHSGNPSFSDTLTQTVPLALLTVQFHSYISIYNCIRHTNKNFSQGKTPKDTLFTFTSVLSDLRGVMLFCYFLSKQDMCALSQWQLDSQMTNLKDKRPICIWKLQLNWRMTQRIIIKRAGREKEGGNMISRVCPWT